MKGSASPVHEIAFVAGIDEHFGRDAKVIALLRLGNWAAKFVEGCEVKGGSTDRAAVHLTTRDPVFADDWDVVLEEQVKAPRVIAKVMFNHWSALFMELIRDETMTIESHAKQLREDLAALMEALNSAS